MLSEVSCMYKVIDNKVCFNGKIEVNEPAVLFDSELKVMMQVGEFDTLMVHCIIAVRAGLPFAVFLFDKSKFSASEIASELNKMLEYTGYFESFMNKYISTE